MRSLERKIGAICRAVAVKVAEGHRVPKTETLIPEGPAEPGGESLSLVFSFCWVQGVKCCAFADRNRKKIFKKINFLQLLKHISRNPVV